MDADLDRRGSVDRSRAVIEEKTVALLAAQAGVWDYDIRHDRFFYCRGTATAFGIPSEDRFTGLPLASLAEVVHPDDRDFYRSQVAATLRDGGAIDATFWTKPAVGSPRRLLIRGDVIRGEGDAPVHASGIVLDLTEEAVSGPFDGDAARALGIPAPDLIAGIDHLIAARARLSALDGPDATGVVPVLDALLMSLGRTLARRLDAGDRE